VFDSGLFAPGIHEGRRLITHELTHVVQQGATPTASRRLLAQEPTPVMQQGKTPANSFQIVVQHSIGASNASRINQRASDDDADNQQNIVTLTTAQIINKALLQTLLSWRRRSPIRNG
jgi:hypothetical protein